MLRFLFTQKIYSMCITCLALLFLESLHLQIRNCNDSLKYTMYVFSLKKQRSLNEIILCNYWNGFESWWISSIINLTYKTDTIYSKCEPLTTMPVIMTQTLIPDLSFGSSFICDCTLKKDSYIRNPKNQESIFSFAIFN